MRRFFLLISVIFSLNWTYAQPTTKMDSSVSALKFFLEKSIRPPATMREQRIYGRLIVAFKIDSDKKISDLRFLKPLTRDYDAEVARALRAYGKDVLLPPAEYSIGVQFLFIDRRHKIENEPFDKSIYQNFLFDLNVVSNLDPSY